MARLSGGQRQAIAVARTISGEADIILLDEPLAAMGAKEGAQILDLVQRLRDSGEVSIILIVHNYVQVFQVCDRVNLIQDGVITFDKPTSETSVAELNEIVVEQYRRARRRRSARWPAWRSTSTPRVRRSGAATSTATTPATPRTIPRATRPPADASHGGTVSERACSIGVDFGTESGRVLVLDLDGGAELAVARRPLRARRDRPHAARRRASRCPATGRCSTRATGPT